MPTMKRLLPPLLALRAFEAAGRHQSFTRAAEELNVTHGAISRQVHALEDFLRCPLFLRRIRHVELTAEGRRYLAQVGPQFAAIERATAGLRRGREHRLAVNAMPSTASLWLLPRLPAFTAATGVEVHVETSMAPIDFRVDNTDLALRVGALPGRRYADTAAAVPHRLTEYWDDVVAEPLCDEILVPVCSRRLWSRLTGATAERLLPARHLIHVVSRPDCWADWFRICGGTAQGEHHGIEVAHYQVALQMAREHKGMALVPTLHLGAVEWRGELMRPLAGELRSAGGFAVLYRTADSRDAKLQAFVRWLKRQASSTLLAANRVPGPAA